MTTKVKRATALNPTDTFREHIVLKSEAAGIMARADAIKKKLKDNFDTFRGVYENENGSKFYDFPATVRGLKGKVYKGMEMRASQSTLFDEKVAEAILEREGVLKKALSTYIDQDKVVALQQQGLLTEDDIDKMFVKGEVKYAFWPVEGEVEED